jgi:four helix bundle protein
MHEDEGFDRRYDIYARVFQFAVGIVRFVRSFPRTLDAVEIGRQLLRAGTSVGANMEEANGAESQRDFVHKVRIARKEAREARYWLRLCAATGVGDEVQCRHLLKESGELVRILSAIVTKTEARAA